MGSATILSASILGIEAFPVEVQIDIRPGASDGFEMPGVPDPVARAYVREIRGAIEATKLHWPKGRVTAHVKAPPVAVGEQHELPIALGVLAASGQLRTKPDHLVVGLLSLRGVLRHSFGAICYADYARSAKKTLMLAKDDELEASLIRGVKIVPVATLSEAVEPSPGRATKRPGLKDSALPFAMSDVRGQESAKTALRDAAESGHSVLLIGPAGAGKTMLARRVLTLLSEPSLNEVVETTKIYSVAGSTNAERPAILQRPFRAPHHTISDIGIVGGGSGKPRPGEVSLAHNGILFLDDLQEFSERVLEALGVALRDGEVMFQMKDLRMTFPARPKMLIASSSPCPCGRPQKDCTDSAAAIQQFRKRLGRMVYMLGIDVIIELHER